MRPIAARLLIGIAFAICHNNTRRLTADNIKVQFFSLISVMIFAISFAKSGWLVMLFTSLSAICRTTTYIPLEGLKIRVSAVQLRPCPFMVYFNAGDFPSNPYSNLQFCLLHTFQLAILNLAASVHT